MSTLNFSLLRGVCQTPGYVAVRKGFLQEEGLDVKISIEATAWLVPHKLSRGESSFAVIPWTRCAAAEKDEAPFTVLAGSGCEEAAIVVRTGLAIEDVKSVAVPREGGMKDLTAMGLLESLGWKNVKLVRQPSGDGAILSLVGRGADAASMVEPYATLMEKLGIGRVVRRTGDVWPGAPGCSLCTTTKLRDEQPDLVRKFVRAFVRGVAFVNENRDEAAEIASDYIGVDVGAIRASLEANRPNLDTIRNTAAMAQVLGLMKKIGYIDRLPTSYIDLSFLDQLTATPARA